MINVEDAAHADADASVSRRRGRPPPATRDPERPGTAGSGAGGHGGAPRLHGTRGGALGFGGAVLVPQAAPGPGRRKAAGRS